MEQQTMEDEACGCCLFWCACSCFEVFYIKNLLLPHSREWEELHPCSVWKKVDSLVFRAHRGPRLNLSPRATC